MAEFDERCFARMTNQEHEHRSAQLVVIIDTRIGTLIDC